MIVGTGDSNNFVKPTIENHVVSLTERLVHTDPNTPIALEDYKASVNWDLRVKNTNANKGLVASELVTGTMALFSGELFFGTFIAISGSNACDMGKGRIHAVDYIHHDATDTNGTSPETYGPLRINTAQITDANGANLINVPPDSAVTNLTRWASASRSARPARRSTPRTSASLGNRCRP